MKAYRIISTEYKYNTPNVFLYIEGRYYGDMTYPRLRNYPKDIEYWHTATCADTDRYFSVTEVEVSAEQVEKIEVLQTSIQENKDSLKEYSSWNSGLTKQERESEDEYNRSVYAYNKPYEDAILSYHKDLITLIKSLA